jgi:hypothetical protein
LRGDSTLYEHGLMRWLDEQTISYATSPDMSSQRADCIATLPEVHWKPEPSKADAVRGSTRTRFASNVGLSGGVEGPRRVNRRST